MNPHLGDVIDDEGDEITFPRKANKMTRVFREEDPNQLVGKQRMIVQDKRLDLGLQGTQVELLIVQEIPDKSVHINAQYHNEAY